LDDFGDIVQKTNDLCSAKDDCLRLKNAPAVPRGEVEPILDLPWEITPERITISDGRWRTRYEAYPLRGRVVRTA
ncbi:hypothetical protein FK521_30095, partial [Klebsiella pneumoniae]